MKSKKPGSATSEVEVTHISSHGIWLLVCDKEYFLPFLEYPWFKSAPVGSIMNVALLRSVHLHWPDLDVDLELSALEHPDRYPLIYQP